LLKTTFVLRALKLLVPEEILKLSEILYEKHHHLKKVAGDDIVVSDNAVVLPQKEAKILKFSKNSKESGRQESQQSSGTSSEEAMDSSDLLLWQRDLAKQSGESLQKSEALRRYKASTDMYVIKETAPEGKDKHRFPATNGVLIDKKQA
jgi:hypothetical protein